MNSLSWLLYAAGTLENLGSALVGASLALFFCYGMIFGLRALEANDKGRPTPKFQLRYWAAGAACALFACLMPSAKTVYMIAASEVGTRAADTTEARELLDLLRARVREALADTKKS